MESVTSAIVRPAVRELHPYRAGTTIEQARRRYGLSSIVKLSSNENPLGPSPLALAALGDIGPLNLYEDDDRTALRARIGERHGVGPQNIICGHGSNDVLMTLFETFVDVADEVVIGRPTFSLFAKDAAVCGAHVIELPLRDGVHDLDAMLAALTPRTKLVIVCDPNNPTGTIVEREAFARFVAALPERVLLVVDQAYVEYAPASAYDAVALVAERPNTVVTRTLSKIYGLASLRFGYAVTSPEIVDYMERVRTPFNVSRPAAEAALAALDDDAFLARTIELNTAGKSYLRREFTRLGFDVYPTAANFHAVAVPVPADRAYTDLMARGVVVRSGDGLRMPGRLRITIGTREENETLVAAFNALVERWQEQPAAV